MKLGVLGGFVTNKLLLCACNSDMYVYGVFLCCAVLTVGLTEGRLLRRKRGVCEYGVYEHEGKTCCLCPTGYRVSNHCTDKNETQCEVCEDTTFMDHNNNDDKCHRCKVCDSNANMEIKEKCTKGFNTVCRCKKSFYCEKHDNCVACTACDKCEDNRVKIECTETSNTVCHDAKEPEHPQSTTTGVIVAVVLLIIVGLFVLWIWKKRKLCFKDEKGKYDVPKEVELDHIDIDLNPHLSNIADVLGWKRMKNIAQRSGMTKTEIEQHELNHPNNVQEQTYDLLQAWSERQGLHGAYSALIRTLHSMKERRTADEIQDIVKKEAISQP